jgi:hypothetical protein
LLQGVGEAIVRSPTRAVGGCRSNRDVLEGHVDASSKHDTASGGAGSGSPASDPVGRDRGGKAMEGGRAMLKRLRVVLGVVLAVALLTGCAALTGKTAGETVDDSTITASVKTRLAQEQFGTVTRIDVDTNRGTVYLNGTVENPTMKARASEIARQVDGVRDVVNNLQVRTP